MPIEPADLVPVVSHVAAPAPDRVGPSVLVDRDGVVNVQRTGRYVNSWRDFEFTPGATDAFRALGEAGVPTFVVTNQGGVGRGFLSATALDDIHDRMADAIRRAGGRLDAIIHCPHAPAAGCTCRKPAPGMPLALAARFGLDLPASTFIGDNVTDLEAGRDAGCATILVGTGEGARSAARLGLAAPPAAGFLPLESDAMPGLVGTAATLREAVEAAVARWRAGTRRG